LKAAVPAPLADHPVVDLADEPAAHRRTRIKICGFVRAADVVAAVAAGADALGFNLYPHSARHVSLQQAQALIALLPPFVTPVLLFVNASRSEVREAASAVPHAVLQFHGDETPADCEATGRPYLRAVRMGAPGVTLLDFAARFSSAQALLLDAYVEGFGGGGKVFDWSQISPNVPRPVVLSGGLNPANVTDGVVRVRPWAVDVSSGVESSKGVKSPELMRQFCHAVRRADSGLGER
jgi:phosphoribosylanthranilate isomerase